MNVDNVTVLSKAEVAENQSPIKPRPMLNVAIAFVIGLMVRSWSGILTRILR